MKKMVGFLVVSCFCLSMIVFAADDLSGVGKKLKSFTKESQQGAAGLTEEELSAIVDEVIEISLEEFEREYGDDPDYKEVSQEEKENGKEEIMGLLKANPELLEQAKDETGEINPKELVEILKNQDAEQTNPVMARSTILMLETFLAFYELDNGFYPSTSQGLSALIEAPTSGPKPTTWNGPYLNKMSEDPWGNPYHYVCPGIHNTDTFDLSSYGPDEVESDDDITNWD